MNIHSLLDSTEAFAARLEDVLEKLGMLEACGELEMDHICVRLSDPGDVSDLHMNLKLMGKTISVAHVNGRRINLIKLWSPLKVGRWKTSVIELPYPKDPNHYSDGWEHVEFVIPGTENTLGDVQSKFDAYFPWLKEAGFIKMYSRDDSEPLALGDQMPNPTVCLKRAGVGVKFHARLIEEVVGYKKPAQ